MKHIVCGVHVHMGVCSIRLKCQLDELKHKNGRDKNRFHKLTMQFRTIERCCSEFRVKFSNDFKTFMVLN